MLFPHDCISCGAEGGLLCSQCIDIVHSAEHAQCYMCKQSTVFGNLCAQCAPLGSMNNVCIMVPYEQPQVRALIHLYKYEFVEEAGDILAALLVRYMRKIHARELLDISRPIVMPVPLSPQRIRERGYNQADIMAQAVAQEFRASFIPAALVRTAHTQRQATLGRAQRLQNIRNAFTIVDSKAVLGGDVILCDDVVTTGATLEACAAALKDAGARRVYAIALAHHLA